MRIIQAVICQPAERKEAGFQGTIIVKLNTNKINQQYLRTIVPSFIVLRVMGRAIHKKSRRAAAERMINMAKLSKDYFTGNEVLIVGYPMNTDPSMKMILQAFLNHNIRVLAINGEAGGDADIKVYKSLAELPKVPACAYIYLDKNEITPWIERLAAAGVKRVLFHSRKDVDQSDIDACAKAGLETAVACPMMLLGKGLHRFHAFVAGVR
jgi:predicted CoA-binding protein